MLIFLVMLVLHLMECHQERAASGTCVCPKGH